MLWSLYLSFTFVEPKETWSNHNAKENVWRAPSKISRVLRNSQIEAIIATGALKWASRRRSIFCSFQNMLSSCSVGASHVSPTREASEGPLIHLPPKWALCHAPQVEVIQLRQDKYNLREGCREGHRRGMRGGKKEEVNFSLCNNIHCISNHPEEDLAFICWVDGYYRIKHGGKIINLMLPHNW